MKLLDNILSVFTAIVGALFCGFPRSSIEFDLFPLGIVFIILSLVMILSTIIEEMINRLSNKNKETNVIINIPKREKVVEKEQDIDITENWELAIDPITKLVQDELFGKENDDDNEKKG